MVGISPDLRGTLAAYAPGRQSAYAFLSAAFAGPPAAAQIAALGNEAFQREVREWFGEPAREALEALEALERLDSADVASQAKREFMNLFKVPTGQYVPAYESVFRDTREIDGRQGSGLLMGPSVLEVQQWYRLAALEITEDCKELPDHISLELQYLAHLCEREQAFAEAGDEARQTRAWEMERDFLAAHVVPWIGPLRDRILAKTSHPYFRVVAEMAVDFTTRDLATLEEVLGPSRGRAVPDYSPLPV